MSKTINVKKMKKRKNQDYMQVATLDRGKGFGDLAILTNKPRAAKVRAEEPTICVVLIKGDYFKVINQVDNLKKDEIVDFLKEMPIFSKFSKSYLRKLAASFLETPTIKNQVIVKEGRKSDTLYIVREGEFGVSQREVF